MTMQSDSYVSQQTFTVRPMLVAIVVVSVSLSASVGFGQKDNIYRKGKRGGNSLVRGKVVATSAFKVTIDDNGSQKEIPASEINKISFAGEPRNIGRARDHLESDRFDDCLKTLAKIDEAPKSKFAKQEMQYLEAMASGKKSLRGDPAITTQAAEQLVGGFVKSNSDSYRLVPVVELHAQLLVANGKTQQAQKEFNKLTKSQWEDYELRGHFYEGETLVHQGNFASAKKSYQALAGMDGSSANARQYKLLATCQLAKIAALEGNFEPAIAQLEKIIQDENADNTKLFASAYNALGTCYVKSGDLKKACRAFLHTELLFPTEADAHAEALYNLTQIWPQLKETERANRARELLTTRYRSSIWASKL